MGLELERAAGLDIGGAISLSLGNGLSLGTAVSAPPFDPTSIPGLRVWVDAQNLGSLWKNTAKTTPVTADGDVVLGLSNLGAYGLNLQIASNGPVYKTTLLSGHPCLDFNGTNNTLQQSTGNFSNIVANNAFEWFMVFAADAIDTNSGTLYLNDALIGDLGTGGLGIYLRSAPIVGLFNYDGNFDAATKSIATTTKYVLACRHDAGSIYISLDGGAEASVASGNSSAITGGVSIGKNGSGWFDGKIGEILMYNVVMTPTQRAGVISALSSKWA